MPTDADFQEDAYYIRTRGRISGPFSVDRLKKMVLSGQFGRVHQISEDRRSWRPAATLEDVFTPRRPASRPAMDTETSAPTMPTTRAKPQRTQEVDDSIEWYYFAQEAQQGPVPTSEIQRLVQSNQLSPDDLVWRDGLADWQPISSLPEFSDGQPSFAITESAHQTSRRRSQTAAIVAVGFTILLGLTSLIIFAVKSTGAGDNDSPSPSAATNPPPAQNAANVLGFGLNGGSLVDSVRDEKTVSQAVGLVICGFTALSKDGKLLEFPLGSGSCFLISPDGYALTNKHVIDGPQETLASIKKKYRIAADFKVWTSFESEPREAEIIYVDNKQDIAIIKIESQGQPYFRLANTNEPPRGTKVFALGFPGSAQTSLSEDEKLKQSLNEMKAQTIAEWASSKDYQYTQTDGTVSRIKEEVSVTLVQHNADINHGNSGGPLVTADGVVVGINTFGISNASGVFYAIPAEQFRELFARHDINATWSAVD